MRAESTLRGKRFAAIARALAFITLILLGLTFLVNTSGSAEEVIEGDHVVVEGTVYKITDAISLVDADLALMRWRAKGVDSEIYGNLGGESVSGFDEAYAAVYDRLLALYETKSDSSVIYYDIDPNNTPSSDGYITNTCNTGATKNSTVIWKINGTVTLEAAKPISNVGKIIIISENGATIQLSTSASQFTVANTAVLSIQGRSADKNIKVSLTSSTKSVSAFQISGGSLYLQYCDLDNFKYTSSLSVILFPTGNYTRYLYMSDSYMQNISANEAPGIFCKAYSTGSSSSNVKKSELYINNSEFRDCLTRNGNSNTVGGSAIRSYAADMCKLQVKNCLFENNVVGSKTTAQTGKATGGGAIYWKSVSGSATLIGCTFRNNHSAVSGGAILNMGTMEIYGCSFEGNTALGNGGAIAVETPYTSSVYNSITDVNTLSGTLTLDSDTRIVGNSASSNGGGIYFNAVHSQIGNVEDGGRLIETYQMGLTVNGAEISENTAGVNGGAVAIYLDYLDREYVTGVEINEGSEIVGNAAAENGGAIWIMSASDCDCKSNEGVIMNGGSLEDNEAQNGGAIYTATGKADVEMNYYINGGTITANNALMSGGAAYIQGGSVIMANGTVSGCRAEDNGGTIYIGLGSFSMSGGEISDSSANENGGAICLNDGNATILGGRITDCTAAENGGAIYIGGGMLEMTDGEVSHSGSVNGGAAYIANGTMTVSGGSITGNEAVENGGALYLGGGHFNVTGGSISDNSAVDGGGAFVANGDVNVSGGTILDNTASNNGGGINISNGDLIMRGGSIDGNVATNGKGGGIYVSSSMDNAVITVSSGSIVNNFAGVSGGALGVHGQDGISFTITIGQGTSHEGYVNEHKCESSDATESCPVIEANEAAESGGGIYLSGSYEAKMNIFCLVEQNNEAEGGVSRSNFMEVEGGTLTISTVNKNGEGNFGNVVINSTVHVNGGKVTIEGKGDSPQFNSSVYVDVNEAEGSTFSDIRTERTSYTVQYFENFGEGLDKSGEYILIDVVAGTKHYVQANLYFNVGFEFKHWILMERNSDSELQPTQDTYEPGVGITVNKNLVLYAKWVAVGYTVVYKPGTENFEFSMEPQSFSYTDTDKALTKNAFLYPGNTFVEWIDEDTGERYANGQVITEPLRKTDGAVVNLVAVWAICYHTDMTFYDITNPSQNALSRKCRCGGYTETATLSGGITTVYSEGTKHTASVSYNRHSVNDLYPSEVWSFDIVYSGKNWEDVVFDGAGLIPENAGKYEARIEFETYEAFVGIVIEKAQQSAPGIPSYNATTSGGKTTLVITEPTFIPGLEYLFTWYDDIEGKYMSDGWHKWTDEADPPSCPLNRIYTNYYVDVRYSETENYNASVAVRGETVIMHTGGVVFRITCAANSGLMQIADDSSSEETGIIVNLVPIDAASYYVYNVSYEMSSDNADYVLPHVNYTHVSGEQWTVWINAINNAPAGVESVTVYISFSGAEKKPNVEASTDKGELFDGEVGSAGDEITVSRDSAYTAFFKIRNYKHYGASSLVFSSALPVGATVIMIDGNDGSYYAYVVTDSTDTVPISTNFVRMGSSETYPATVPESEQLSLRFIIDFSRCESYVAAAKLTASFYAVPIQPSAEIQTVPALPAEGGALSTVNLVNAPRFDLYVSVESDDSLSKNLTYQYADPQNDAVGISRWDARRGILVITPSDLSTLPPDMRLKITIGTKTDTYYLSDGKYIIPLPVIGTGSISITLVSDMIPNEDAQILLSVKMFSSFTLATTAPDEQVEGLLPINLTYTVKKTPEPTLHAELAGELPEYADGAITPTEFRVMVADMPIGYGVRVALYAKDGKSGEYILAQNVDLSGYFAGGAGDETVQLEFNALLDRMSAKIESLSLMAQFEIVDQNEKAVTTAQVHFILKDTRQ